MKKLLSKSQYKAIIYVLIMAAIFFVLPALVLLEAKLTGGDKPSGYFLKLFVFPICSFAFPFALTKKYGIFWPFPVIIAAMYLAASFLFYGHSDMEYMVYYLLAAVSGTASGRILYMIAYRKAMEASKKAVKKKQNPYRQKKKK